MASRRKTGMGRPVHGSRPDRDLPWNYSAASTPILRAARSRRSTSRSTSPTDAAFLSKEARGQPSENRFSAGHRDGRTRYVARKRIGQYDVCRRKLGWLAGHFIGTCLPNFATASCGMVEGMSG
jgi:hypothetical protein